MALRILQQPTKEPVTVASVKQRLLIDHDEDDNVIAALITAAREKIESWEWRTHMPKVYLLSADSFPRYRSNWIDGFADYNGYNWFHNKTPIWLPYPPLISIDVIRYILDGVTITMPPSDYMVDNQSEPGRVAPVDCWPCTDCVLNAVEIEYTAGYAEPCDVPRSTQVAITEIVRRSYGPTADCDGNLSASIAVPDWLDILLNKAHDPRPLCYL